MAWLCGTGYAATDELHQWFVAARSAMWQDVCLDKMCIRDRSLRNRKAEELEPGIFLLDNHAGDYIVSLYAGIWRKDFMEKTLTKTLNAWQYEVALTNMARQLNARCADSRRGEFPILDVIRKGKVLTKARKYFDGNPIYKGDREDMRVKDEWMLEFRTWLREWLPKPLFNLSKAIMRRRGYTFFSDNQ